MNAIRATFHNFGKPNLQRKTFSFMMEAPIEHTQAIVDFFGSPSAEDSNWFAILPINTEENANVQESGNNGTAGAVLPEEQEAV